MEHLFQERFKEANLDFQIKCPKNIGFIYADERRIKQLIFNLMNNAIAYTQSGGEIILGAKPIPDGKVLVWVQDSGVGIAKGELTKVFERFFKSKTGQNKQRSGTGLGLSVVKHITEIHKGEVEISSSIGKGTKISCTFSRDALNDSRKQTKIKQAA